MILPNGAWTQDTADATHQSSEALAKFLIGYLDKDKPTFDFGCGNGFYLSKLEEAGFKYCKGFEGTKLNNSLNRETVVVDLTRELNLVWKTGAVGMSTQDEHIWKGNVISLEVGEHLPKEAQETFMQTVTKHCAGKLVFSWAEIGQPGLGHINCRDIDEVIQDVRSRGFIYLQGLSEQVRATIEDNCSWFQRTLLIFEKIK